jgi:hypothetical protein
LNQLDALMVAAGATASLMLLSRGLRRFNLTGEMKLWMGLAWLLIIVTIMLIARALQLV